MNRIVRYLMLAGAWTACIIGCIGVFVPVLPTTPLLLLATFLFARSSPRCHAWIVSTKVRILTVSFVLMGASAFFVRKPFVWIVLGCVALFLLYLMLVRIPTISPERVQLVRRAKEEG